VERVNISELCRRFGISRKTGYKWLGRYASGDLEELRDRSQRPYNSPRKSGADVERVVLGVREAHPAWGGRKIAHVLARDQQRRVAASTVMAILHRHGLIRPEASEAARPCSALSMISQTSCDRWISKGISHLGRGGAIR
jgi:transposase